MAVLVACEFSGRVRDAFLARGIDAVSCDLRPTESPGPHITGDVLDLIWDRWDMVIAHPPCNDFSMLRQLRKVEPPTLLQSVRFFHRMLSANAPLVAVENVVPNHWARPLLGAPDFRVHPWQFGHPYSKGTCFWTRGLPPLLPTCGGFEGRVTRYVGLSRPSGTEWAAHEIGASDGITRTDRPLARSRTFPGIADAIATQWGALL